jgi:hypothetical protein
MIPMTLKAFRCDRTGFLPELFTVNSRRFYHGLSTVKASVTFHAPHRSAVVAFIRLATQKYGFSVCQSAGRALSSRTTPSLYLLAMQVVLINLHLTACASMLERSSAGSIGRISTLSRLRTPTTATA